MTGNSHRAHEVAGMLEASSADGRCDRRLRRCLTPEDARRVQLVHRGGVEADLDGAVSHHLQRPGPVAVVADGAGDVFDWLFTAAGAWRDAKGFFSSGS
ncbi:hypothetical protein GCM10010428_45820 [Actinosynnema pretiosum subsp. pretiosum]